MRGPTPNPGLAVKPASVSRKETRGTRRRQLVHHLSCVLFASVEVAGPGDVILTEGTNGSPFRNGQRRT
jgi:hypothetical protein